MSAGFGAGVREGRKVAPYCVGGGIGRESSGEG